MRSDSSIKFSVLMSVYKNEKSENIQECFSSIQNQTLLPDEIILVVDGPINDVLNDVIENWVSILPLKIVRLDKNVGLGSALNIGIKYCSNEYIFRMDTDDICLPERFLNQCQYLKDNEKVVLLGGQICEFNAMNAQVSRHRHVPCTHKDIVHFSKFKNPFNHMTVAFKKDKILEVGGYQHHLFMEDYNLWLRVIASGGHVANLSEVLVNVRTNDDALQRRRGVAYIKSEFILYRLKRKTMSGNFFFDLFVLVIRSAPRLLPLSCVRKLYGFMRR